MKLPSFLLLIVLFTACEILPYQMKPTPKDSPSEVVIRVVDPCFSYQHEDFRFPIEVFAEKVDSCNQVKYDFDPYMSDENGWLTVPKNQYNHFYIEDDWGPVVACDIAMSMDTVSIELICPAE